MVGEAQRRKLVTEAQYLISKEPQIHYAEVRPMTSNHVHTWSDVVNLLGHGGHLTMDCSESVTSLFRWAGLRDPNGNGYDGTGYTGTLLEHLPHYENVRHAHPGALLVFGGGTGVHVCMLMERGGDNPMLFSHGQEAGPLHISLSEEAAYHAGQTQTWLDISHL